MTHYVKGTNTEGCCERKQSDLIWLPLKRHMFTFTEYEPQRRLRKNSAFQYVEGSDLNVSQRLRYASGCQYLKTMQTLTLSLLM